MHALGVPVAVLPVIVQSGSLVGRVPKLAPDAPPMLSFLDRIQGRWVGAAVGDHPASVYASLAATGDETNQGVLVIFIN